MAGQLCPVLSKFFQLFMHSGGFVVVKLLSEEK